MINGINALKHLFLNPFDEIDSSLVRKTAFVAFHVFTLGIPYAIYHFVDNRFPNVEETVSNLKEIALNGLESKKLPLVKGQVRPYTFVEWEALNFADKKMELYPEFMQIGFLESFYESEDYDYRDHFDDRLPQNPKISAYTAIRRIYEKKLLIEFQKTKNPWNDSKYLRWYDEYLKISFAIAILTLEDLSQVNEKVPLQERSLFRTLVRQDAYPFITIGFGINAYHAAKNECRFERLQSGDKLRGPYPDEDELVNKDLFYETNTLQNRWNKLYNDFCNRLRMYVSEEDVSKDPKKDDRIFLAAKIDKTKGNI